MSNRTFLTPFAVSDSVENLGIYALGFAGQALFGARLTIQWWLSERNGKVVSPVIYWYLSLVGSAVFLIYGIIRLDPVIVIGQTLSYYIYIRNLQLKNVWANHSLVIRIFAIALVPIILAAAFPLISFDGLMGADVFTHPIMILGTVGQLALNLRFIYQWQQSEKVGRSTLPIGFWHISVWASVAVIVYSLFHPINQFDLVLFVSQTMGIVVYIRNLILAKKEKGLTDV